MIEKESPNDFTLRLSMRQLSLMVAGFLAFSFFVFIAGYFLGQKRATQEFLYKADQDSLADQIYSSMCVLYDAKDDGDENAESADEADNIDVPEVVQIKDEPQTGAVPTKKYQAALVGFPASGAAEGKKLVARLTAQGFPVELVERASATSKGKKITWYQVVTKPYESKSALETAVQQIAHNEHIKEKSISISECV